MLQEVTVSMMRNSSMRAAQLLPRLKENGRLLQMTPSLFATPPKKCKTAATQLDQAGHGEDSDNASHSLTPVASPSRERSTEVASLHPPRPAGRTSSPTHQNNSETTVAAGSETFRAEKLA